MRHPAALSAAVCFGIAACSNGNPGTLSDSAPELVLVEELRIGSVDDTATMLTWTRGMEIGPDGRIYSLHPQDQVILVHDAEGNRITKIGGRGEGPGEFQNAGVMGFLGDTLWVMDYGNYSLNYFDLDGGLLRTDKLDIDLGSPDNPNPPRPRGLRYDGTILAEAPTWSHQIASGELTSSALLRWDRAGNLLDTIATYPLANTSWEITDPDDERGPRSYASQPFTDTKIVGLSPVSDQILLVDRTAATSASTHTFHVTVTTFDGDTTFSREFEYAPISLEEGVVDSVVARQTERLAQSPFFSGMSPSKAVGLVRRGLYVPAYVPPVATAQFGRDGTVWIERERMDETALHWMVLDSEGRTVGRVAFPAAVWPLVTTSDAVWGMHFDELDVPYIVRYAVPSPVDAR